MSKVAKCEVEQEWEREVRRAEQEETEVEREREARRAEQETMEAELEWEREREASRAEQETTEVELEREREREARKAEQETTEAELELEREREARRAGNGTPEPSVFRSQRASRDPIERPASGEGKRMPSFLSDAVFNHRDLLNIIFSTLKPLSEKPLAALCCKTFCGVLSDKEYNRRRQWIIDRRKFEADLLRTSRWCECNCFRVAFTDSSSKITLNPRCQHFSRLLALVRQTPSRKWDMESVTWMVSTSQLRGLLDRVYRSEPDALLPRVRDALMLLDAPGPIATIDPAINDRLLEDYPTRIRDFSRFGSKLAMAARLPALREKEAAMRHEEASFLRRQSALPALRDAMRAASTRQWTNKEMHRLKAATREAELAGGIQTDNALMVRALALIKELKAEQTRTFEAAVRAAAELRRVTAVARLRSALKANDGPIAECLDQLAGALDEAEQASVDDSGLVMKAHQLREVLTEERQHELQREAEARAAERKAVAIKRLDGAIDAADAALDEETSQDDAGSVKAALRELKAALHEALAAGVTEDVPLHNQSGEGMLDAARTLLVELETARVARLPPRERATALCCCNRSWETGPRDYHVCRLYGFFKCQGCGNSWVSGRSFIDLGYKVPLDCRRCRSATEPFRTQLLENRDGQERVERGEHPAHLCHMCRRLQRETGDLDARCDCRG